MNDAAGYQPFVKASATRLIEHFTSPPTPEVIDAIKVATGAQNDAEIEQHRQNLLEDFTKVRDEVSNEIAEPYIHYASRIDIVGVYQSMLGTVFKDIPGLQGYGDKNAVWVITPLEELGFKLKDFFHEVHELRGGRKTLLQALIEAWKENRFAKSPYPSAKPVALVLD